MIEMANAPTITLVIAAFTRAPNKLLRNIENERKNRRILRIFDPPSVLRTVRAVGEEREGWNLLASLSQRQAGFDNSVLYRWPQAAQMIQKKGFGIG